MVDGGGCKMANPFHSTGSPIVDRMCRLQFTGNVIPAAWYRTITRDNGKPNLTAIIILSDVVYWYRPVEIRDELTGQLCGFRKKFKADILQRNYQQLADQFGISKREAVNAVVELEKIGVVRRVFRTVRKGGMRNSNVLFLEQDMRSFELYGTVGAVVCCLDSLNYLLGNGDLVACFRTVHNYLDPGGLFLFDMNTPYKHQNVLGENVFTFEEEDASCVWRNHYSAADRGMDIFCAWQNFYDEKTRVCDFDLSFFEEQPDGSYLRSDEHQQERCYDLEEIRSALATSGMELLGLFSDYRFSAPTGQTERWYFAARAIK